MAPASKRELHRFRLFVALLAAGLLVFAFGFRDRSGVLHAMVLVATAYAVGLIAYLIVSLLGWQPPRRPRRPQ